MRHSKLTSQKPHIGIFGRRNVGKSSLINALTDQEIAIVSEQAGTTTDPVTKTLEIPEIGPVILTDTAGIDDEGALGEKRVAKSRAVLDRIDLAIIVISHNRFGEEERGLLQDLQQRDVPFFLLHNKMDLEPLDEGCRKQILDATSTALAECSCCTRTPHAQLIDLIRKHLPTSAYQASSILGDLISEGDLVVLVTPIDIEAPEGRLILPQVQAIRDCLDHDAIAVVLKERELDSFLRRSPMPPKLVVTDSQAFLKVSASVPKSVPLTSFSILFARLKGDFARYLEGTPAISKLREGDRVLILESCSHHVEGDDIGRVKIPRWLSAHTGKKLHFDVVAGLSNAPLPIADYQLVIQCGGCMLTRKQVLMRLRPAIEANIPVTNYGMTIAYCLGIFQRAVAPFLPSTESVPTYL